MILRLGLGLSCRTEGRCNFLNLKLETGGISKSKFSARCKPEGGSKFPTGCKTISSV